MKEITVGRIVLYRTATTSDAEYDIPAIVTCTSKSHPGDANDVPSIQGDSIHLKVHSPCLHIGSFQKWNVAHSGKKYDGIKAEDAKDLHIPLNTWRWPT